MADISLHCQPTIIFVEDCYLPQSAQMVVEVAQSMDSETVGAQLYLEAVIAELFIDPN